MDRDKVHDHDPPWFGLRVRRRSEQIASAALVNRGYNPFLPACKQTRRWSDRKKQVEEPLFPGYLFCRFDPHHRLPIISAPGVLALVGAGNLPTPIAEEEIEAIRVLIASGLPARPWPFVQQGDRASIIDGPLRGIEGIVTGLEGDQLILSITMMRRSVSVQIEPHWVRRA